MPVHIVKREGGLLSTQKPVKLRECLHQCFPHHFRQFRKYPPSLLKYTKVESCLQYQRENFHVWVIHKYHVFRRPERERTRNITEKYTRCRVTGGTRENNAILHEKMDKK